MFYAMWLRLGLLCSQHLRYVMSYLWSHRVVLSIACTLRGSSLPTDSIEPLVKQVAADLALPPTAAETALTVLSGHRVRSRAQLGMLATHRTLWDSLPIAPPALKQALYVASYGAAAKPARSRWPWLVLPLLLGGVGVLVWRSPQAMAFVKRIRIER